MSRDVDSRHCESEAVSLFQNFQLIMLINKNVQQLTHCSHGWLHTAWSALVGLSAVLSPQRASRHARWVNVGSEFYCHHTTLIKL